MRRRSLKVAIFALVVLDFLTPEHGLMNADAQSGPATPFPGNAYEWENGQETPKPVMLVDPLNLRQRVTVNPDGSTNSKPVISSTAAGPGAFTLTSTSTVVIAQGAKRFIAIDNESASATIACSFGGTAALNTAGSFTIPPMAVRVWNGTWVPADAVQCISGISSSPATIQVQ